MVLVRKDLSALQSIEIDSATNETDYKLLHFKTLEKVITLKFPIKKNNMFKY